jgi:hypothetical protein
MLNLTSPRHTSTLPKRISRSRRTAALVRTPVIPEAILVVSVLVKFWRGPIFADHG